MVRPIDESGANDYESNDDGFCGRAAPPSEATALPPTTPSAEVTTGATPSETTETTRIIGDSPAPPHAFPWTVAMLIDGKAFCGGSIIDEEHVLTAGHCTEGAEQITILIGAHDIKASKEEEPGRLIVNVTKEAIFTHPKYDGDRVFNDISIIRLPEKLTYNANIRPVCLPNR